MVERTSTTFWRSTGWQRVILALVLILAAVIPELPAIHGRFQWDDEEMHITKNPNLHDAAGLVRTWIEPGSNSQYYPLAITGFWLEYHAFGADTTGYHVVNLAIHALNVLLAWGLLRRLRVSWAWLVALIFAMHPMIVESVAYISELKNLLSGAFFLLAAHSWLNWREASAARGFWYTALLAAFTAAMFGKSIACTFPVVMLLLEYWRNGRIERRSWIGASPLLVVGLGLAGLFIHMEHQHVGASGAAFEFSLVERVLIAGRALCFYAGKLLVPDPLLTVYPRWSIDASAAWQFVFPAAVAAVVAGCWAVRRWSRGPLAGVLAFIILLSPALGFVSYYPMIFSFVADHYVYLAVLPWAALCLAGFHWIAEKHWRPALVEAILAASIVVILGPRTWIQAGRWQTKVTLWEPTAAANPGSWYATANLAYGLVEEGRYEEASREAKASLALKEDNSRAHFTLALARQHMGDAAGAAGEYERGLALENTSAVGWFNLGVARQRLGDLPGAAEAYRRAGEADPRQAAAWNNLAALDLARGAWGEAAAAARRAVAADGKYGSAHVNLALALQKQGQFAEAISEFRVGLALVPANPRVRLELARTLMSAGDAAGAVAEYQRIVRESPDFGPAKAELQMILNHLGSSTQ